MNQYSLKPGVNDLATKVPALLEQWDYDANEINPDEVMPFSSKKAWWICSKGHRWEAVISSRVNGRGCPFCACKKVWIGFNDLLTNYPDIATEWDSDNNGVLSASEVTASSHIKVWWKCSHGHSYKADIRNRTRGTGCPYCCGRAVLKGFNDLKSCRPDLYSEWNNSKNTVLADELFYRSSKRVWWICQLGHEWETSAENRVRGTGCPVCAGKVPVLGQTDFKTMNPKLMKEWNVSKNRDIDPSMLTYQSRKKVWWKCKKGHEWRAEIFERRHGAGCPICSRNISKHVVIEGKNDLKTLRPDIALEWDDERNEIGPNQIMVQSNKKVWWICARGHRWRSKVQDRTRGKGCPRCAGKTYSSGHFL